MKPSRLLYGQAAGALMDGETLALPIGADRRKNKDTGSFRAMHMHEAAKLKRDMRCWFLANDGSARGIKINGKPRTWKTRPGDVDVPCKYGMYEHAVAYYRDRLPMSHGVLLLVLLDEDLPWDP